MRTLTINGAPVVTVIGKAVWDIGHASKDGSTGENDCLNVPFGKFIR